MRQPQPERPAMKTEPAETTPACGITLERDVDVPMRDGARLKADVFRPDASGKVSGDLESGSLSEGQAVDPAEHARGKTEPADELGYRQPALVGAQGLCRGARRRPRQR